MEQKSGQEIAFGPVPSRRLGRSLGVNNIPPKICTYSCVYCQLGRTIKMQVQRQAFYEPERISTDVRAQVEKVIGAGEPVDHLTFVPDGEPTLDLNLGREIELLRPLEVSIAVITNASLIWRDDVRTDLLKADWVSLKVDAVDEDVWRRIDRPHGGLELTAILEGALAFVEAFEGELATETMLVAGVNDGVAHLENVVAFLGELRPDAAYLAIPTRPPAEDWVRPPAEGVIARAYQIFDQRVDHVEYLIGYEGDAFTFTGDIAEDLLSITAVHPMREGAVKELLARAEADWSVVQQLIDRDQLVEAEYDDQKFYVRRLQPTHR